MSQAVAAIQPISWEEAPLSLRGTKLLCALSLLTAFGLLGYALPSLLRSGWSTAVIDTGTAAVGTVLLAGGLAVRIYRNRSQDLFQKLEAKVGFDDELHALVSEARVQSGHAEIAAHLHRIFNELLTHAYDPAEARQILKFALRATPWHVALVSAQDAQNAVHVLVQAEQFRAAPAQKVFAEGENKPELITVDGRSFKRKKELVSEPGAETMDQVSHQVDLVLGGNFVPPTYVIPPFNQEGSMAPRPAEAGYDRQVLSLQPFLVDCLTTEHYRKNDPDALATLSATMVQYNCFCSALRANKDNNVGNTLFRSVGGHLTAMYDIDEEYSMSLPHEKFPHDGVVQASFGLPQAGQVCSRALLLLMTNPFFSTHFQRSPMKVSADKAKAFMARLDIVQTMVAIELSKQQPTLTARDIFITLFGKESFSCRYENAVTLGRSDNLEEMLRTFGGGAASIPSPAGFAIESLILKALTAARTALTQGRTYSHDVTGSVDLILWNQHKDKVRYSENVAHFLLGDAKHIARAFALGLEAPRAAYTNARRQVSDWSLGVESITMTIEERDGKQFLVLTPPEQWA